MKLKSVQAEPCGANGDKLGQMGPSGTKQDQIGPNGAKWGQTGSNRAKWGKWGKIGPNGAKQGQTGSIGADCMHEYFYERKKLCLATQALSKWPSYGDFLIFWNIIGPL